MEDLRKLYPPIASVCLAGSAACASLNYDWITLGAAVIFYAVLAYNAIIDWQSCTLIIGLTNIAIVVALSRVLLHSGLSSSTWWEVGFPTLAIVLPMFLISRLSLGRLLGMGDVRLSLALCLWHGNDAISVIVLATILAGVVATGGMLLKKLSSSSIVPYGPFLVGASWLVWMSDYLHFLAQSLL